DFDMVMVDPWSVGYNGPEDAAEKGRFLRPLTWVRQGDPDDNGYARPVMPVTTVGFQLRADGFFDGNPALDLPPAEHGHHES
ncbi:MAG TPA: hypothetical protein VGL33_07960, partial [Streptosporangiaceae bacterium]